MTESNNHLFTAKEAAQFLRISDVTLWRERRAGRITFRRVATRVVFLRSDLDEYLDRNAHCSTLKAEAKANQ